MTTKNCFDYILLSLLGIAIGFVVIDIIIPYIAPHVIQDSQ